MLDNKDAFLHVIYEHRYLSLAGSCWRLYGPDSKAGQQGINAANHLMPGVGVPLRDSLLLHARTLIEFYTDPNPSSTDTPLSQFDNVAIDSQLIGKLQPYKKPIEVHALHLTIWRDHLARRAEVRWDVQRPDWDVEATPLVELLLGALLDAGRQAAAAKSDWARPFGNLHDAASNLFANPHFPWPADLGEKRDVHNYLVAQGL
ncbi:hypothetical protein [Mycobacterium marinum]|uniref:hypothetical protein n=1 Tax=Mycobacterium marinum TaxID=1781 RepID=UPI000B96F50F|nr:hypothetical protein [Mycobacterium marinum]